MKANYQLSLLLSFLMLFVSANSIGQHSKIDSPWNTYREAKSDSARAIAMVSVAKQMITINSDTATLLLAEADSIVKSMGQVTPGFALNYADLLRRTGLDFHRESEYSKSIECNLKAIDIYGSINNALGLSQCNQNLGNTFFKMGNFDTALKYYYTALEYFDATNNTLGIADCYNNIGSVLKEMESYDKAMEHHILSQGLLENLLVNPDGNAIEVIKKGLSNTHNNIGIIHWYKQDYDQALKSYKKSLGIKQTLNDLNGVAQAYKNIAILYATQGIFEKGVEYFQQGLDIYLSTGNKTGLTSVHANIAYLNLLLAQSAASDSLKNSYLTKALTNAQHAFEIAKSISSATYIGTSAGYLKDIYEALGDTGNALRYANELLAIQKDIFSQEKANALAHMTTRYEAEKNMLQLESMTKEKEFFKKRTLTQQALLYMSIGIIAMLSVFLFVLLKYFKQKRKTNEALAERNEEIIKQKDALEKQKTKIDDSIFYAKFIQSAMLPDLDTIFVNRSWGAHSYFILYKPKDVVSGDFYWATRINDWIVFSVVDCTGHGVPGALMSMLGISIMNEIVVSDDFTNPSRILTKLRSYVIDALKQKKGWNSQRDGMDMSILSLNTKTKQCFWAGANNPLWIVRANTKKEKTNAIPTIEEIKPDPFPVAIHMFMGEFTNHEIDLYSGDRLYMFSDGFLDQFGGPNGKKFNMHKAFNELIAKTSDLPIKEQGKVLEETFDNWITCDGAKFEQTDDVTVLGITV